MRALVASLLTLLLLPAAAGAAKTYSGYMGAVGHPIRSGEQGQAWQSVFVEHKKGPVTYTACVVSLSHKGHSSCKAGHTGSKGTSTLNFSGYVNNYPGRWKVIFVKVGGVDLAPPWTFTVHSEGV